MKIYLPSQAPTFLASKWLHIQLLVSTQEIQHLIDMLGDVFFFSSLGPSHVSQFTKEAFIDTYTQYIDAVCTQEHPEIPFRFYHTCVITKSEDAVASILLPDGRHLIHPQLPLLQMRPHRFVYSAATESIRSISHGPHSISWGVQISYPQMFQETYSRTTHNALNENFENFLLFRSLQSFIRHETEPTPFHIHNCIKRFPIRIGKNCFSWIDKHQELKNNNLKIISSI